MARIEKYNTETLAKSLAPGIEALIGSQLDSLITEAVKIAEDKIRTELVEKCSLRIKQSMNQVLNRGGVDVRIDLTLGDKDEMVR